MKLMDRYIVRELIVPFLAGSFTIALLFAANQLIYILKTFNSQAVPASAMVQMVIFRMPYWLNLTLPAGISLAAALAMTRLARESEITAMRASGVRVLRVILPVALFGLVIAVGDYALEEKVIPKSQPRAEHLEIDTAIASAGPLVHPNVWLTLKGGYSASFGSVTRQGDDSLLIRDVTLGRIDGDTTTFITAPTGTYLNGIWHFDNVRFWDLTPAALKLTHGTAEGMTIFQPIFLNDIFSNQEPEDKTAVELAQDIKSGKALNRDMTPEEIAYYERFSVPGACIVFAAIAPIFGIMFSKSGSFAGVLLAFVLVLLYYNAFVVSTDIFGRNHWLNPWLAAWAPNIAFAALGLLAIRRLE
ncbi:MAG TPA: LptF/LptG family permease [Fimbriimonadaceae bacterium]|nr:LptF/LptG family permease [Fimbriimonadaceae bacterium]